MAPTDDRHDQQLVARRPDVVGRRLIEQAPGTAYAAAAAAKQRRQKIIAAVLGVVLLAVLVYEVPQLLKLVQRQ